MMTLLKQAGEAFKDGVDPFSGDWPAENEVTLDECMDLSTQIAACCLGFVNAPADTQGEVLLAYAVSETPGMARLAIDNYRLERARRRR